MARSARYCVPFRRRREGKTDYRVRKAFILSGKPRLVVRTSLNNVTAQIIAAKPHGDEVLVSAHSRELIRTYGWKASRANIPAAYLTGFLCGQRAKNEGIEETILDIGLRSPSKGSKIFALLNGVLDAGVEIPHDPEKLPSKESLEGQHIMDYAQKLASTAEIYQLRFSKYLKLNLRPETLAKHFEDVKQGITSDFKKSGGRK